jgi:hypothetical protein
VLPGAAGGTAEILWIALYSALTGSDPRIVAAAVATSVLPGYPSPALGVFIHMLLALALGCAVLIVWRNVFAGVGLYAFMLPALAAVWVVNFFIVLPVVAPEFGHLLPYSITFVPDSDRAQSTRAEGQAAAEVGPLTAAFGLALGLTSVFNALLVILKETYEATVLAWMNAAGHHWITHGVLDLMVFAVLGLGLAQFGEARRLGANTVIATAVGGIVLGGLIIVWQFRP